MTVVCGDSHTSTHGAFGALAFGIRTSEVSTLLATQTLPQPVQGLMSLLSESYEGSTAKDVVLAILNEVGTGGGMIAEFRGSVVENLSMEGRMTLCNMSINLVRRLALSTPTKLPTNT